MAAIVHRLDGSPEQVTPTPHAATKRLSSADTFNEETHGDAGPSKAAEASMDTDIEKTDKEAGFQRRKDSDTDLEAAKPRSDPEEYKEADKDPNLIDWMDQTILATP